MEVTKICFKCSVDKSLSEYYRHPKMGDGHLNKCKDCTKRDSKKTEEINRLDPSWVEKEKERHRKKYYRLGYKEKHKPTCEQKKKIMSRYWEKYPEKEKAKNSSQRIPCPKGFHNHHWSYNEEHYKDVIQIESSEHYKLHRHTVYDAERKMYRRSDNNILLDTREAHEEFIKETKHL